jgi:beta-lactamase superfamily II metal-dependent hydrolase
MTKTSRKKNPSSSVSQTKKRPQKAPAHATSASSETEQRLRIRMYRVGFGDFFLMTVPADSGSAHILIDCGVTNGRTGKGDIGTIKDAVADMADETGKELALIIVTHRHMDHIIGFSRCADQFKDFKVAEIWMSIWETEYDSKISGFQSELNSLALSAQANLAFAADDLPEGDEMLAILENATGNVLGMKGTGGGTNAQSLALLKNGFGVKPKYYCKGQKPELPDVLVRAGLSAEILGPPPTDALAFMKLMDLRKGVGQYLQATAAGAASHRFRPFQDSWQAAGSVYPKSAFREWGPRGETKQDGKSAQQMLEDSVRAAQPSALLSAMKQLDNFLNNQSLVVLFTYKGNKLLFAGDAQGGNWEYWLYDGNPPTTTPSEQLGKQGAAVLSNLAFYKVGHHGSTNATPIAAVEHMNEGFAAMCSTQENSFGSVKNNSEVPRKPLLNALASKCTLVRSDQIPVKLDEREVAPADDTKPEIDKPKAGAFEVGSCFVDYKL